MQKSNQDAVPRLQLDELEVGLGPRRLILDQSCALRPGRLYLMLGRSGSGKSSFARALLGFGELSDPAIECHGRVVFHDAHGNVQSLWEGSSYEPTARQQIAFLPQAERLGFLDALSVEDNLALFSHLEPECARKEIDTLAHRFQIVPLPHRLASASGGERIRLSAIRGLVPRRVAGDPPELVIADEPTAGLDHQAASSMVRLLVELARSGNSIVIVITHEPARFLGGTASDHLVDEQDVRLVECRLDEPGAHGLSGETIANLRLEPAPHPPGPAQARRAWIAESLGRVGAVALAPIAFVWGLLGLHRPFVLLRQVLNDASGPGTHAFSLTGCLLVAGTISYFIFERMPKPELVEPLLLPETLGVTGHALARVILPLGACCLITAKLGAAQSARLAAAVRGGLLETLALAGWRVEAFALVPTVAAQFLAMTVATATALAAGILLSAVVYVAGHDHASLPLTVNLMLEGLEQAPNWTKYAWTKIALSSFLGGTIAALCGIAPSRAEDDVARAVHRTLLWSVLAVIACQCLLILMEFAPK